MIYFLALIPATGLTVGGYIVLYLSSRMEGGLKTFGKYLAFWAFTLAALVMLGAIFAAAHHHRRAADFAGRGMHYRMHGPWGGGPGAFGPRFFERRDGWAHPGPDGERPAMPAPAPGGVPPAGAPASPPAAPGKTP